MAKKEKDQKKKSSFGRRLFPLAMGAVLAVTPFMLAGCSNGQDGKNGADGSQWHYGASVPGNDLGKVGDFYLEGDGDVWIKTLQGWEETETNIKGPQGQSNYVHIKYADEMPDHNDDMKETASSYIGIYNGTSATAPTDYTKYSWKKIVGETGGEGQPGQAGQSVFIAYATQADGSDMVETYNEACEYLGIYTGLTAPTGDNAYQSYTWVKFREAANIVNVSMEYGDEYTATGATFISGEGVLTENDGVFTASTLGNAKLRASNGDILNVTVSPATVDVVLFTGQSNMVGRDTSQYTTEIKNGQAYEYKYNNGGTDSLVAVANPVGETFGNVEVSSGSSIVPEFCELYTNQTGRKIVAVHVARGGRAISNFEQGGAVYQNIISKYTGAIDYLTENENFNIGKKFYLMFQGESDTGSTTKEDYKTKYLSFHNGLKTAFGMEFGAMFYTGRDATEYADGIVRINTAKYELATENEDIILCSDSASEYLSTNPEYLKSDNVHFNAAGMQALAAEACTSIVNWLGYGDESKEGVDPVTYITAGAPGQGGGNVEEQFALMQYNGEYIQGTQQSSTLTNTTFSETDGYTCSAEADKSYYVLDREIKLETTNDWTIEWQATCGTMNSTNANVILGNSSGKTAFITYQSSNGIYVKGDDASEVAKFTNALPYIYQEHTWKLVYTASTNTIALYMDNSETALQTLSFNSSLTLQWLFNSNGGGVQNYYFVGNIKYFKITEATTQE